MYLQPHHSNGLFSWTTIRGKHCRHTITVMGVCRYVQALCPFYFVGCRYVRALPTQLLRSCYNAAFRAEMYLGCKSAQLQFAQYFIFRAPAIFLQLYCKISVQNLLMKIV